jgi:CRP/FNR family cyclic AMP-dependent transcriptional regulator
MATQRTSLFDSGEFIRKIGTQKTTRDYGHDQAIFSQGDAADAMFYIQTGTVKLTVISKRGKKAIVGILRAGDLFGEGCLSPGSHRTSNATAIESSTIWRVKSTAIARTIHREPAVSRLLIAYLLGRMVRIEEDFVDQLFNFSERRLARVLLLLADFGKRPKPHSVMVRVNQGTLADMIGTTRSRVSHFMNRFREMGFIQYDHAGLTVHRTLLTFLHE